MICSEPVSPSMNSISVNFSKNTNMLGFGILNKILDKYNYASFMDVIPIYNNFGIKGISCWSGGTMHEFHKINLKIQIFVK